MDKIIHLRFHHEGEFQSTRYHGGIETDVPGINTNIFSYTVLMEHVKDDLEYSEIGGIYVRQEEFGNWKLLTKDSDLDTLIYRANSGDYIDFYIDNVIDITVLPINQMQPHVVIRARHNLLGAKKQVKRQFVTAHQLQQQQKNKKLKEAPNLKPPQGDARKSPRLKNLQQVTRKSPQLNNLQQVNDATMSHKSSAARRKLDLQNPPHEDEIMGENDPEEINLPHPPPLTDYERQRAIRIQRNNQVYFALNLPALSAGMRSSEQTNKGKKKRTEDASDKEGTCQSVQPAISANPLIELPRSDEGNGSMATFFAMRKCQKEKAEKAKAEKEKAEKEKAEKEKVEKEKAQKEKDAAATSKNVVTETILPDIEEGDVPGMRQNVNVMIFLDVKKALAENKIVLTEGFDGVIPVKYFERIESRPDRQLLYVGKDKDLVTGMQDLKIYTGAKLERPQPCVTR